MMETLFWLFASGMSVFFGLYAPEIFVPEAERNSWNIQHRIYQGWFNFMGSLMGWVVLYFLLFSRFDWGKASTVNNAGATDVILLIIAFIGITGHIPLTIVGILHGSYVWLKNLLNKLS